MSYFGKVVTKIKSVNSQKDGKVYLGLGGYEFELEKNERIDLENAFLDEFTINSEQNNLQYQNVLRKNIVEYTVNDEISRIVCNELDQYSNYIRFEPESDDNLMVEKVLVILHEYGHEGTPNGNLRKYSALGITDGFITLDNNCGLFLALYEHKPE